VRKAEQDRLSIEELGWKHENKPIVFVETETDYSVFSVLGNMYTGNTQLKDPAHP
jgi:predicted double-glycine peptidase